LLQELALPVQATSFIQLSINSMSDFAALEGDIKLLLIAFFLYFSEFSRHNTSFGRLTHRSASGV
jgi:hypothetical protein